MADITLHVLKPSVNNLTARIFVRAAGLDFEEIDVWGSTGSDEFLEMNPSGLTPTMQEAGLPAGCDVGELRDHAVPLQQARARISSIPPIRPLAPRSTARCSISSQRCTRTWPRATYGALGFPQYPGEVGSSDASDEAKAAAQKAATEALARPLEVYHSFFLDGKPFIGGDSPSIADIRLAASLEFLRIIDYPFPAWLEEYMSAMESTLGDAYSEPVADVRGYIDYVRSQAA